MTLPSTAAPGRAAWRPTLAHARAGGLALALTTLGLVLQRPDLLVLGAPFVLALTWGQLARPTEPVRFDLRADRSTAREGEDLAVQVRVWSAPGVEAIAVSLRPTPHLTFAPGDGGQIIDARAEAPRSKDGAPEAEPIRIPFQATSQRWGQRVVGPGLVGATSAFGAFRFGPGSLPAAGFLALPRPTAFDASAPLPHPRGLVGAHRSVRPGEGAEFYAIREFQVGDRTRRIHWPRSLREDRLYVRATHADQDAHVAIVLDAHQDLELGDDAGHGSRRSTLDLGVRSAAAVAEHFLGTGDRVSLTVLSAHRRRPIRPGSGPQHLRRVLHTLARVTPLSGREDGPSRQRLPHLQGGLVVLISPLASPDVAGLAAALTRSGQTVVVVDVMVEGATPGTEDGKIALAWRIRALEREDEIHALRSQGVPVVPWAGPGSLDLVLRGLARRGPTVRAR